jgi:hypothetical protein
MATMTRQEAGRVAARARWGPPRVVRLDDLNPDDARLIRALLAQRNAPVVSETPTGAGAEGHGNDRTAG